MDTVDKVAHYFNTEARGAIWKPVTDTAGVVHGTMTCFNEMVMCANRCEEIDGVQFDWDGWKKYVDKFKSATDDELETRRRELFQELQCLHGEQCDRRHPAVEPGTDYTVEMTAADQRPDETKVWTMGIIENPDESDPGLCYLEATFESTEAMQAFEKRHDIEFEIGRKCITLV